MTDREDADAWIINGQIDWDTVESKVNSGKTAWIQSGSKEAVLEVCARYGVNTEEPNRLDDLRKRLVAYIKSRRKSEASTESNGSTQRPTEVPTRKGGLNEFLGAI